jgi:hypothetical protein
MASHNGSRVNGLMTTLLPITVRCGGSSSTSRTDPVQRMSGIAMVADSLRRNSSSVQEASSTAPTQSRLITFGRRVVISVRQSLPNRRPHRGIPPGCGIKHATGIHRRVQAQPGTPSERLRPEAPSPPSRRRRSGVAARRTDFCLRQLRHTALWANARIHKRRHDGPPSGPDMGRFSPCAPEEPERYWESRSDLARALSVCVRQPRA